MKKIKLTTGEYTLVDDEDFELLNQWKWRTVGKGYVARTGHISGSGSRGTQKTRGIYMHREIMNPPDSMEIDHINRNKLDNTRINLKICTATENQWNTGIQKNNKSGYKGVGFHKASNKWRAYIQAQGKYIHLGDYSNIQGAWLARKWGERIYFI